MTGLGLTVTTTSVLGITEGAPPLPPPPAAPDVVLLESGDALLLESGDNLLTE